jgi:uncharacterized membrane protein
MTKTLLALSVVTAGLMAGLFAAFGYAVMPGLRRTGDAAFVGSMRGINQAILNPVFGLLFGGALILLIASAIAVRNDGAARGWVLIALVLYVATLGVTLGVNVPLNNRLEAGSGSPEALRLAFENRWVTWNVVRAVLSTGSFAAVTVALLVL